MLAIIRQWLARLGAVQVLGASLPAVFFVLSLMMLSFAYGAVVVRYQVFPYHFLKTAKLAAQDLVEHRRHYSRMRPDKFIFPARQAGEGVTVYDPSRAHHGLTLITGLWDGVTGIRLVDMRGVVVNEWRLPFSEVWPEAPHLSSPPHDWDTEIHGAVLYPDGSVVFTYEYDGLAKVDACSNVLWRLPYRTHHSVFLDSEGNLWVPGSKEDGPAEDGPVGIGDPRMGDQILKISARGELLEEFSLMEIIVRSGDEALITANGDSNALFRGGTHLNDIELLEASSAQAFGGFSVGDILVSARNLNLVAVIDRVTKKIKWYMVGPFVRQHDPDFLPNGRIAVFDNRKDDAGGRVLGGSRILEIEPTTRTVEVVHGAGEEDRFFTNESGGQQYLPNGNVLVTEAQAGRVLEITRDGGIVWSYINRWDEDEVAQVNEATRYPLDYVKGHAGGCK